MLNKLDLIKKFELTTLQEIKNHNEQVLNVNIAINSIRQDLDSNKKDQAFINAAFGNNISSSMANTLELSNQVLRLSDALTSIKSDREIDKKNTTSLMREIVSTLALLQNKLEFTQNSLADFIANYSSLEDGIKTVYFYVDRERADIKLEFLKEIEKSKQSIINLPCKAEIVKKEIEEKLSIDRVDFEGVMRELQVIKKDMFIKEKLIENLYTQIERLKCHKQES